MHAPPPDLLQAAATQPAKPKKDPMSFPPGLIPQLVAEKLKTDPPYSPLSPLDIDQAGLPPTLEPDSYLKSRIDRFFAELQVSHGAACICGLSSLHLSKPQPPERSFYNFQTLRHRSGLLMIAPMIQSMHQ